jgi:hypothetical protein
LRTLGALLAIAVLFAAAWHLSLWLQGERERSVESTSWPVERITPANLIRP